MISNPINAFTSGSNVAHFTYEGGSTLFHWSPNLNRLSNTMENNLIFFANDEAHALDVLKRMFQFIVDCVDQYLADTKLHPESEGMRQSTRRSFLGYLQALEANQVWVDYAPTNQFFIVGWAGNSNVH